MTMLEEGEDIEFEGLFFTAEADNQYHILDVNYEMAVGTLKFEEGPGWILYDLPTFLDMGHLRTVTEFVKSLPSDD